MAKSLETIKQEMENKIQEVRGNLESLSRNCDHCFPAQRNGFIRDLENQTYNNLRAIERNLKILSKSKTYQELYQKSIENFKDLLGDYLFLKAQYSL